MSPSDMSESELMAWVDGQLPPARQEFLEGLSARDPALAARVLALRAQRPALHAAYDDFLDAPIPDRLLQAATAPTAPLRAPSVFVGWRRWMAMVALTLLGGGLGWQGHATFNSRSEAVARVPLPRQAAVAHVVYVPDQRRPVEITADQEEQLVRWLTKRLGKAVRVPHLGLLGYELVGGRLLPGNQGPVAQFMYQAGSGERLTLYLSGEFHGNAETGFRFATENGVNVFYWVDGAMGYALSGALGKDELARVGSLVFAQLEKSPG